MPVMIAKGSTIHTTLDFLQQEGGAELRDRVRARLADDVRARVDAARPTDELPLDLAVTLWRAADQELGGEDPGWIDRAGAYAIASTGQQRYGGILHKATPSEFLTQGVSLFQLYYHPGNMEVVEEQPGRIVLRLIDFDVPDRLFCARQTGGLRQTLLIAGGEQPTARHVRCTLDGDAFCEWQLTWR